MGKTRWRTEPGTVAIVLDDLWLAVKFQSNSDIAGSPRNSFRASVVIKFYEGKALNGLGGFTAYRILSNCECHKIPLGVRLWGISFIVKRETAQTAS